MASTVVKPPSASTIRKKLALLGKTPGQVAKSLVKLGMKGKPDEGAKCPLAVYLNSIASTPGNFWSVGGNLFARIEVEDGTYDVFLKPTATLTKFIDQFDSGKYPELIA